MLYFYKMKWCEMGSIRPTKDHYTNIKQKQISLSIEEIRDFFWFDFVPIYIINNNICVKKICYTKIY